MHYNEGINISRKFNLFSAPWLRSEEQRGTGERGQLTSAAPCVTAEKQQGNFRWGAAAGFGSEESEPSHRAGWMTISLYVSDEREI